MFFDNWWKVDTNLDLPKSLDLDSHLNILSNYFYKQTNNQKIEYMHLEIALINPYLASGLRTRKAENLCRTNFSNFQMLNTVATLYF